jgi:hypothetical protein
VRTVLNDRLRLTPRAKLVLQEAGKPLRRGKRITSGQVLLRLFDLEPPDPAAMLLTDLGVDIRAVREHLAEQPLGA